jgi:D-3-phosphoglycerate dehydrogenase
MMRIVFSDYIDLVYVELAEIYSNKLKSLGEITIYQDIPRTEEEIIKRIADAEIITVGWINITASIIKSSPSLKYIIVSGVGYDNVDVKAATEAGIKVINSPKHNSAAVAEYTIALILSVTKKIIAANTSLKKGNWNTQAYIGTELSGKKLGLIGYGNIARKVAQLATNFGMSVSYANSKTPAHQLDELIAAADILSLHLPITESSKYLMDERRLNLMKKSAYLINTARGAIIDQKALFKVLQEGRIAGAAIDVFEHEPITDKPSEEILQLAQLDNVVGTPHIAYNTEETAIRLSEELIENIQACLSGSPINVVN